MFSVKSRVLHRAAFLDTTNLYKQPFLQKAAMIYFGLNMRNQHLWFFAVALCIVTFISCLIQTGASAADSEGFWKELAPMPTARTGVGVVGVNGKIYAIGGVSVHISQANEVYDPTANSWTTKAPIPSTRDSFGVAAVDDKIYCIGGSSGTGLYSTLHAANEMYDPKTDTWTKKAPLPTVVGGCASAVLDSKIYIITIDKTQIYDTKTDTWSNGPAIPTYTTGSHGAATTGVYAPKRIYVVNGTSNWVFDPRANSWSQAANPLGQPLNFAGIAVLNDQIYCVGGFVWGGPSSAQCQRYTPVVYHSSLLSVSILSPSNNQSDLYGSVDLTFTVNRETADLTQMSYRLDGQTAVAILGNTTLEGLPAGTHSLTVSATDTLENTAASLTVNFTVTEQSAPTPSASAAPSASVPEFPTWIILPLVFVAAVLALNYSKKKLPFPTAKYSWPDRGKKKTYQT